MSETRPPMTAGPMERAFKFLKSTSVSDGAAVVAVAAGDGLAADDNAGGALSDDDLSLDCPKGFLQVGLSQ